MDSSNSMGKLGGFENAVFEFPREIAMINK